MKEKIERLLSALEKNNIKGFYVDTKDEVCGLVKKLIKKGEVVSAGGSVSLHEAGVIKLLNSGNYNFLDRSLAKTREEIEEIYRKSYTADTYFCSSNALTENGELFNVDGNSNRVSAILYGPKSVIMVVGINKIVKNIQEAQIRVKEIAAPKNTQRLNCETYCNKTGHCIALNKSEYEILCGCDSDARICCNYVISAKQRHKDRIKVIIVGENLGY